MENKIRENKINLTSIIVIVSAIVGYGIWIGNIQSQISATETLANESKQSIIQLQNQNSDIKVQLMKLETQLSGIQGVLLEIKQALK